MGVLVHSGRCRTYLLCCFSQSSCIRCGLWNGDKSHCIQSNPTWTSSLISRKSLRFIARAWWLMGRYTVHTTHSVHLYIPYPRRIVLENPIKKIIIEWICFVCVSIVFIVHLHVRSPPYWCVVTRLKTKSNELQSIQWQMPSPVRRMPFLWNIKITKSIYAKLIDWNTLKRRWFVCEQPSSRHFNKHSYHIRMFILLRWQRRLPRHTLIPAWYTLYLIKRTTTTENIFSFIYIWKWKRIVKKRRHKGKS